MRVLRPEVDRLDAAGDGDRAVADDVGRPERFLGGGEACLELARIGAVELEQVVGRAELGVDRGARVVDERDAADRGRDRDGEERQDQELLPPLAAEQAPGPADTARRAATPPLLGPRSAER